MASAESYDVSQPGLSEMQNLARETWHEGVVEVPGLGYALEYRPETPGHLISFQSDGIGTKGLLHAREGSYEAAAVDALAMCVNDALLVKSEVKSVIDYVSVPTDDPAVKRRFMGALAEECKRLDITISAGETAVMNTHEDISPVVTTYGLVELPQGADPWEFASQLNRFQVGDVLIGLRSNGIHANGLTDARRVFESTGDLDLFAAELTQPTRIYYDSVPDVYEYATGLMHITGGGFSKLKHILPQGAYATIENPMEPQPIFHELHERGISEREMYQRFNCGTGFVIGVRPENVQTVSELLPGQHLGVIGEIRDGTVLDGGVRVRSAFSRDVLFL